MVLVFRALIFVIWMGLWSKGSWGEGYLAEEEEE